MSNRRRKKTEIKEAVVKREAKYRAWDTCRKKMWSPEQMGEDQLTLSPDGKGFINVSGSSTTLSRYLPHLIPLQYTDRKDRNKMEIYEGDIVNSWEGLDIEGPQGHGQYWRKVVRDEDEPRLRFEPETGSTLCKNNEKHFKVIGNIYENPELLK